MSNDYDRSREALEDAFWRRREELSAIAREQRARVLAQRDLVEATGIHDLEILRELIAAGLTPETITALAFVPLVAVAWASGSVHPREREVAIAAAIDAGIPRSSEAFAMYATWLEAAPEFDLLEVWGKYVRALRFRVTVETYAQLCTALVERARRIAEAAGGPGMRGGSPTRRLPRSTGSRR